jgi:MFS superfamily sulfate permease-like transporter
LVGYKLADPAKFIKIYNLGYRQFVPFIVTVLGLVFTDLLIGVGLGLVVGIVTILLQSYNNSHFLHKTSEIENHFKIRMAEEVTFLNKGAILRELNNIPEDSFLEIDVRKSVFLDYDIVELLDDFSVKAKDKNIDITIISERGVIENPSSFEQFFKRDKVLLHNQISKR